MFNVRLLSICQSIVSEQSIQFRLAYRVENFQVDKFLHEPIVFAVIKQLAPVWESAKFSTIDHQFIGSV